MRLSEFHLHAMRPTQEFSIHNPCLFFHNVNFFANFVTLYEGNLSGMSLLPMGIDKKARMPVGSLGRMQACEGPRRSPRYLKDEGLANAIRNDRPATTFRIPAVRAASIEQQLLPLEDAGRAGTARVECTSRTMARDLRSRMSGACRPSHEQEFFLFDQLPQFLIGNCRRESFGLFASVP